MGDIKKLFNLEEDNGKPISSAKFFEFGMSKEDYMMYLSLCDNVKAACVMAHFEWLTKGSLTEYYKERYLRDFPDISSEEEEKKYRKYCNQLHNNHPELKINYYDLIAASFKTLISFLENFEDNHISIEYQGAESLWLRNSCYYQKVRESVGTVLYDDMSMIKSLDDFRGSLEYLISFLLSGHSIGLEMSDDLSKFSYEELLEYEAKIKAESEKYPWYQYTMSFNADNYNEITDWAKENELYVAYENCMETLEEIKYLKEEYESKKNIEEQVKKKFEEDYEEIEDIFNQYNKASALICLKNLETGNILAVIVAMSKRVLKENIHVVDYRDRETRQLLTDIYKHRKDEVEYSGGKFSVFKYTDPMSFS